MTVGKKTIWKPEDGVEGFMEVVDGPSELAVDRVPTADAVVPLATYPDWRPEETRIVRCRIANDVYPGDRYESRPEARDAVTAKHGPILEANYVPGQAFFRVRRINPKAS